MGREGWCVLGGDEGVGGPDMGEEVGRESWDGVHGRFVGGLGWRKETSVGGCGIGQRWKETFRLNLPSNIITSRQPRVEPGTRGSYDGCSHYFPGNPLLHELEYRNGTVAFNSFFTYLNIN